ncbi:tetratricopeptide repeat protein 21A [Bombina bombina]|uniref:tetratricopeptide repeat protein 21A n=1 Tax=Bombina bombina TaxID=8345 RepID=UPI00235AE8E1|nr:tetratricopeptide repeat protein 21A [Bombina bombina]
MAETDSHIMAAIIYYSHKKYFRHVQNLTREGLQKHSHDPVLLFFKTYGMLMEDRVQEAIRELDSIKDVPEVSLCCSMALIYAHRKSELVDHEVVTELENKVKTNRKTAGAKALYYAGMFLWLLGRNDKAKEYVDRMLKLSNMSKEGLVLKGWLDLTSGKDFSIKKSIKYFNEGVQDSKELFGIIGKATLFMMTQNYSEALEVINQVIVSFPAFIPALILKMELFLAQQDWDQTLEIAQRILTKDVTNFDALQIQAIHSLTREGNVEKALHFVKDFISSLETIEPRNPKLHLQKVLVLCSVCGHNREVLDCVFQLMERSFRMAPTHVEFATEFGYQNLLRGNVTEAARWYLAAMKLDESCIEALTGTIWCQTLQGHLEEANQQLDFLHEVEQSVGRSKEMCYAEAILASKSDKGQVVVTNLLKEAVGMHFAVMDGLPLGVEYFEKLSPNFLINIVKEYLAFCPKQPKAPGQQVPPLLHQIAAILSPIIAVAPALTEPLFYMAKTKYLAGDLEVAQGFLLRCIELAPTSADVHLLMAQVHLSQGNFTECSRSLETGVSYNFKVREHPMYYFIKAKILKNAGEVQEAIKNMKMIMSLPEVKKGKSDIMTVSERASIYLELAELLRLNGEQHESTKVMQDALHEFSGTQEEVRVIVANADLAVSKGDVEMALNMLRNISPKQPYYIEVKEKMAHIYLTNRRDKNLYIGCLRELSEQLPGPQTSLLLGDAYMSIQEPEKALEVYDQAQRKNPQDAVLASRIGQALVKTHQYKKAINYYEASQKISGQDFLCHDLANLLIKMKHYNKAEKVLQQALNHESVIDLMSMINDVKCLILLGKTYENYKNEEVFDTLNKAYELQLRILKRVPLEQPEIMPAQKQVASAICVQLAEHFLYKKDYEKSLKYYKEATGFSETDIKVMLDLSRLYLIIDDLESCERQCDVLLQNEKFNEGAAMMMADIMFRKQNYETSIELFKRILEKAPDNFIVLRKLIDLLRRSGKLSDATAFFDMALAKSSRVALKPGYNYCKGLYHWYIGQPNEALKLFNKARKDSEWGQSVINNMVQICLNPDNELVGGEVFESLDDDENMSGERRESEKLGIRTAEKLLKEYHPSTVQGQNHLIMLQCHCLMATKDKVNVETALATFTEFATNEKENVPAILAVAQAYMILKQIPRARNQLKRLSKITWSLTDADDLEKSWLLLADVYIKSGKYDISTELLKRCLLYNKSCCKAYEYLGYIMEKEQSYKDAAENYQLAWKYSSQSNPSVGFRLAFNYLKDKKYVDAIDVCHKVLKDCPAYPIIRKEILEKAQACLKP